MKKTLGIIMILALVLTMITGCGIGNVATSAPTSTSVSASASASTAVTWKDKQITIRFLNRYAEGVEQMYKPLSDACKEFSVKYPNVKVVYEAVAGQDDTQYYEKMRTAAATGDMYELMVNYGGSTIRSYVENGILLDLSKEFTKDPSWKDSFLDVFSMWKYDGIQGTYGVPFSYFATMLFCNDLLFKQYNLTIPKTISELEKVSDAFVAKGVTPMPRSGEGWRWAHWATGLVMQKYGSDLIYDLASRKKTYTGPEMMSIAQLFVDWQKKGYFGKNIASLDSATEQVLFSSGKSPMIAIGPWQIQHILANGSKELIENVKIVWFPYFDESPQYKNANMGGAGDGFSVAVKDEYTTTATLELLKFLTSKETMTKLWEASPTALLAVKTATPPAKMDNLTKSCIELINTLNPSMMQEIDMYDPITGMQDTLRNAYAGMMAGGTAEAAMKKVQDEITNFKK